MSLSLQEHYLVYLFFPNLFPVAAHGAEDSPVKKSESFGQGFANVSQADEEDGNSPEGVDDGDKLRKSSLLPDSLVDKTQTDRSLIRK